MHKTFLYKPISRSAHIYHHLFIFAVTACTSAGCITSDAGRGSTGESVPLAMHTPTVEVVNSTALQVIWSPPQITNGYVRVYHLKVFLLFGTSFIFYYYTTLK